MEYLTEELIVQKSSQELTALLYEGLIGHLEEALGCIEQKNMIAANQSLQKASDIIQRLGVGLRYEAGPLAENLDSLYNYMANRTIEANYRKDTDQIKHVKELAETLAAAWNEAMHRKEQSSSVIQKVSAYENHVMRTKR